MKNCITLTLITIIILGCKEKSKNDLPPAVDITGYLKGQLKLLDTVPYGILKITENGLGRSDSVYLKKNDLAAILAPFIIEEINQDHLSKDYYEKSFADASTQSVNITYDAKDKDAIIHQIVIYINPDSGNITHVYLTGYFRNKDGLIKKQLLWLHNKGFQVISSSNGAKNQVEKVYWQ